MWWCVELSRRRECETAKPHHNLWLKSSIYIVYYVSFWSRWERTFCSFLCSVVLVNHCENRESIRFCLLRWICTNHDKEQKLTKFNVPIWSSVWQNMSHTVFNIQNRRHMLDLLKITNLTWKTIHFSAGVSELLRKKMYRKLSHILIQRNGISFRKSKQKICCNKLWHHKRRLNSTMIVFLSHNL